MWREFEVLKAENAKLSSRLRRSENLRKEMEKKLHHSDDRKSLENELEKILKMKWTRAMRVNDDEHAGLLFDLSENSAILRALDENMAGINHASRNGNEHPLAIFSENELETVSYPILKEMCNHLREINGVMKDNINIVGHMVVPQKRVEISGEFAGVNGN